MKRIAFIAVAIFAAACTDSPSAPASDAGSMPAFTATSDYYNVSEPFQLGVYIPCAAGGAGETVQLEGMLRSMVVWTTDSQGMIHLKVQDQPEQVSGIGLTTGLMYRGTGVTQEMGRFDTSGLPVEFSFISNYRIIGQGAGNDLTLHITNHFTINANGDITATVGTGTSDCG